jgi:fibronectin type 3 domain-containing protein
VNGASVSIASNATNSPAVVSLSGTGAHSAVLQWTSSTTSGVTYNVYRGTSPGGESTTPLNPSAISTTMYTDIAITPGQQYYYTVEALDSAGTSPASNEVSALIPSP